MYLDPYYFILVVPTIIIALFAQARVKSTFKKYSNAASSSGINAAQAARRILDINRLENVKIERVSGNLTDHYDPKSQTVRLSDSVYESCSVAAIGIAAHEVGHAVQHSKKYAPLSLRNAIIPVTNIGSRLSFPLILLGIITSIPTLIWVGIFAFAFACVFQIITLPVEFNASSIAMDSISSYSILDSTEIYGAKKVLSAAAMTYVAALAVSLASLLRLMLAFGRRR